MGHEPSLEELRAEERYHRNRLALYRAKELTGRPTMPGRLRELERTAASATARLNRALSRDRLP